MTTNKKSFFKQLTETVLIDDENSITLRAPTYGENQMINSKAMVVSVGMDGNGSANFDPEKLEQLYFHNCIVSWNGPGFEGREVTPENIDLLPTYVLDLLAPALNRLSKGLNEEKKEQ